MGNPDLFSYIACPDCDGLFSVPETAVGDRVLCNRCGARLLTRRENFVHRAAALVLAAAMFFVLANLFPFMTMEEQYRQSGMRLAGSVSGLEQHGYPILAGMVGVFLLAAPALLMGAMLYVLLPLTRGRRWRGARHLCRAMEEARRWSMAEVYLLGVLVSLLKLGKLAQLTLGVSFWAFVGLIVCLASAVSIIDRGELWRELAEAQP